MSQLKIKDGNNWIDIPASGIGVPSGGTTGQVLQKSSGTDYATEWGSNYVGWTLAGTSTSSAEVVTYPADAHELLIMFEDNLGTGHMAYSLVIVPNELSSSVNRLVLTGYYISSNDSAYALANFSKENRTLSYRTAKTSGGGSSGTFYFYYR